MSYKRTNRQELVKIIAHREPLLGACVVQLGNQCVIIGLDKHQLVLWEQPLKQNDFLPSSTFNLPEGVVCAFVGMRYIDAERKVLVTTTRGQILVLRLAQRPVEQFWFSLELVQEIQLFQSVPIQDFLLLNADSLLAVSKTMICCVWNLQGPAIQQITTQIGDQFKHALGIKMLPQNCVLLSDERQGLQIIRLENLKTTDMKASYVGKLGGQKFNLGHTAPVDALEVDLARGLAFTGCRNKLLCAWDVKDPENTKQIYSAVDVTGRILTLQLASQQLILFATDSEGVVTAWDANQAIPINRFHAHKGPCMGLLGNGILCTWGNDKLIRIWGVWEADVTPVEPLEV